MAEKILILGGTAEAAELAEKLHAQGHDVTTSLAGRTREPRPVAGHVRMGGFGGAQGLADFLAANGFTRLIDATHPFATRISANATAVAKLTAIAFEQHQRPGWQRQPGDRWTEVASLEQARDCLPRSARVLLALGSQHIAAFSSRADVHFLVRMVDPPQAALTLPDHELLIGKPGDAAKETALLTAHRITHVVCRNSGGKGAYAKIEAARGLDLEVVIIERPLDQGLPDNFPNTQK